MPHPTPSRGESSPIKGEKVLGTFYKIVIDSILLNPELKLYFHPWIRMSIEYPLYKHDTISLVNHYHRRGAGTVHGTCNKER